ncbi:MAG: cation-translocating P-type ATPase C-terminal domain-containing protein, partial [Oscillospiraceae bacterium]|nr:cation-translocating P-type ATPase C-terminal domain-containing protein [Oscillospiraceae bacterium]
AILFGWGLPVMAIQLLFINVVADGIPDLCICKEELEDDAMKRGPISPKAGIFANGLIPKISVMATLFTVVSLIGFYIGKFVSIPGGQAPSFEIGQTMAFLIIGWSSIINIFNARSNKKSIFTIGFTSNRLLFLAILFSIGIVAFVATVPYVRDVFYCVPLDLTHWLIVAGLSISPIFVGEMQKVFLRRRGRR